MGLFSFRSDLDISVPDGDNGGAYARIDLQTTTEDENQPAVALDLEVAVSTADAENKHYEISVIVTRSGSMPDFDDPDWRRFSDGKRGDDGYPNNLIATNILYLNEDGYFTGTGTVYLYVWVRHWNSGDLTIKRISGIGAFYGD